MRPIGDVAGMEHEMAYPITSRFAVCTCGNGFSVEDRKTGERVSFHTSYNKALKARNTASIRSAKLQIGEWENDRANRLNRTAPNPNGERKMTTKSALTYIARIQNPEKRRYALDLFSHYFYDTLKQPDTSDYNLSYMGAQAVRLALAEHLREYLNT
jgi:hypothetical protein